MLTSETDGRVRIDQQADDVKVYIATHDGYVELGIQPAKFDGPTSIVMTPTEWFRLTGTNSSKISDSLNDETVLSDPLPRVFREAQCPMGKMLIYTWCIKVAGKEKMTCGPYYSAHVCYSLGRAERLRTRYGSRKDVTVTFNVSSQDIPKRGFILRQALLWSIEQQMIRADATRSCYGCEFSRCSQLDHMSSGGCMESITQKIDRLDDVIDPCMIHISSLYSKVLATMGQPSDPNALNATILAIEMCEDFAYRVEHRSRIYDAIFVNTFNPADP